MCGRYALTLSAKVLAEVFDTADVPEITPRYNIAPTQQVATVRRSGDGSRRWHLVRWGLIPHWAKDAGIGARMINARGETVASKPAFRTPFRRRRCLVAADGFYEWQKVAGGKQPHLIRFADGRAFAFAGLWEQWQPAEGDPIQSCTILTTRPNPLVATIHDRMPVILDPTCWDEWAAPVELAPGRLDELLTPHPADAMEAVPVSRTVNSPAHDSPDCVRPLD